MVKSARYKGFTLKLRLPFKKAAGNFCICLLEKYRSTFDIRRNLYGYIHGNIKTEISLKPQNGGLNLEEKTLQENEANVKILEPWRH
jgi:hypothetical protein